MITTIVWLIHRSIQEIVLKLQENIDNESQFEMVIRRSDVLQDSLNHIDGSSFDPTKKINVGIMNQVTHFVLHIATFRLNL